MGKETPKTEMDLDSFYDVTHDTFRISPHMSNFPLKVSAFMRFLDFLLPYNNCILLLLKFHFYEEKSSCFNTYCIFSLAN